LHSAVYTISHVFFWGGEEGSTKVCQNLLKVSPKVLPTFWQNFISSKFKLKKNTNRVGVIFSDLIEYDNKVMPFLVVTT